MNLKEENIFLLARKKLSSCYARWWAISGCVCSTAYTTVSDGRKNRGWMPKTEHWSGASWTISTRMATSTACEPNSADETSRYGCQRSNRYRKATKDVAHKMTTRGLGPLENIAHGDATTVGQQLGANYSKKANSWEYALLCLCTVHKTC